MTKDNLNKYCYHVSIRNIDAEYYNTWDCYWEPGISYSDVILRMGLKYPLHKKKDIKVEKTTHTSWAQFERETDSSRWD